jgi:hypothetical protein
VPDIFEIVLKKLRVEGADADADAIGDAPYDAVAAGKGKIATVWVRGATSSSSSR